MIGKPIHLGKNQLRTRVSCFTGDWTECGVQSHLLSRNTREVECVRCRKTRKFKQMQRIANASALGFVNINPVCWRGHLNGIETKIPELQ